MRISGDVFLLASTIVWRVAAKPSTEVAVTPIPPPLAISASQYWDGVDGQWSTFAMRVGTPSQSVRVIVSTNSPETIVVLPEGCTKMAMDPLPLSCASDRGGVFDPTASTTWNEQGLYAINDGTVGFEANLKYSQNSLNGQETLGLGFPVDGPTLKGQTVAAIGTTSPFYLGIFGLGTQPFNYSTIGNFSAPSYFQTLRSQKLIPSLSWSYTAGAKYRLKAGQVAQLIFGGFDTSRFVPNTASFTLAGDVTRDVVVAVQTITYSGTTQKALLPKPIYAFVESTDPNLWLPAAACKLFEDAFGLKLDNATGLYLINDTHYLELQATDPKVTLKLANSLSGGQTVDIVMPFNSFMLKAAYPFIRSNSNATYYFPLRQANDETQYTLGRAFMQEAYLTVDYERGNFSISQCSWNDGATPQLASIISPDYPANATSLPPPSTQETKHKSISTGVVIAIAIVAVLLVIGLALLAFFIIRRRKRPVSKVPTEDINLTHVEYPVDSKSIVSTAALSSIASPAPTYKKMYETVPEHMHENYLPRVELPTQVADRVELPAAIDMRAELPTRPQDEVYQLPDHDNRNSTYLTATRSVRSARSLEPPRSPRSPPHSPRTPPRSPRSPRGGMVFELQGNDNHAVEMDDAESRKGLSPGPSPMITPNDPMRGSPRIPSPMSPMSPWGTTWLQDGSESGPR